MRFQPVKCYHYAASYEGIKKNNAVYSLECTVDNIEYLGVTISMELKWNTRVSNVCTKANRTLGHASKMLRKWHTRFGATNPGVC